MRTFEVSEIWIYPVKSCQGILKREAKLTSLGLENDRCWMVVNDQGVFQTQRQIQKLAAIKVTLDQQNLILSSDGVSSISIPIPNQNGTIRKSDIWGEPVEVRDCGDAVATWLAQLLGSSLRLVKISENYLRSKAIALFDSSAIHIINLESVNEIERVTGVKIPPDRYRATIVMSAEKAFVEDSWKEIKIGDLEFPIKGPCTRCMITTVDQTLGKVMGPQPLKWLAQNRMTEKSRPVFGLYLHLPEKLSASAAIRVGDKIIFK